MNTEDTTSTEICFLTATEMAEHIRTKKLSAKEVMEAHLSKIEETNAALNAIVTLLPEQAMEAAARADEAIARGNPLGPLHGLPVAHKDLALTKGIRTTFGSPIYQNFVPDRDSLIVERLKKAGALTIGKTNTPEFGAGSQTFNEVFGATLNPYNTEKTCGGSSGGAAVALACGMIPIADGSDFGGSLRNPANFCNVVGFRSSPGRVPIWPGDDGWQSIAIHGPMARTVQDIALLMTALAGPDPRCPIALSEQGSLFAGTLDRDFRGTRIAWSADLGGLPVDPQVSKVLESQRKVFEEMGCRVELSDPDFSGAEEIFLAERGASFALKLAGDLKNHRDKIKDTVIYEIETGMQLTGAEIGQAVLKRTELFHRMRDYMEDYEFLVLPVNQVPPFDVTKPYVEQINGVHLEKYTDWMKSCWYISVTRLPAISVPCGFTDDGLPVGIQIVGRHQDDMGVLQLAFAFEKATRFWKQKPPLA
ncbi:MAG: amidase [SAR324 cluster bacterium]|nr:amidase [SAR324 cluster bacterium]